MPNGLHSSFMTALEFENISKQYQLGKIGTGTLSKDLNRWWARVRGKEDPYLKIGQVNNRTQKANGDFVWALRDINFKVEQGEVVGIIGKNGSGKSTLLKILSKVTSPTIGTIRGRGRVASLLEVGTGFHPEMTGRENIYMNGAIMGMTKAEIDRKLDEIVDFAGIQMYVDTPVKRYSSGMTVRLGFAVAAHLESEILLVDEVLAVGDAEFQKKAIGKMQDVSKGEGRTVLFVSHNMGAVRKLCTRGIVLQNGTLSYAGATEDAIDSYIHSSVSSQNQTGINDLPEDVCGNSQISFQTIEFLDEQGLHTQLRCGRYIKIRIKAKSKSVFKGTKVSVVFRNMYEVPTLAFPTILTRDEFLITEGDITFELTIPKLPLTEGIYSLGVFCNSGKEKLYGIKEAIKVEVFGNDFFETGRQLPAHLLGLATVCDHSWNIR